MADQTWDDIDNPNLIWYDPLGIAGELRETVTLSVGGNTARMGDVLTKSGETSDKNVDRCVTTDLGFSGVLEAPVNPDDDYVKDDVITDGSQVYMLRPSGTRLFGIYLHVEATGGPVAWNEGERATFGTEAGKVRKLVYADGTRATDGVFDEVAKIVEYFAGDASDDKIKQFWY